VGGIKNIKEFKNIKQIM